MKNPILVWAEGELMVFDSVQAAEAYAEWQDVEAGVYPLIYDSEGRRLRFEVARIGRGFLRPPRVVMRAEETAPIPKSFDGYWSKP